jgi:hypothetical protein
MSMLLGMKEAQDATMAAAAAGSECSSGCQSGWTTYLDDDRSSYSYSYDDTAQQHQQQPCYGCDYSEEEDDLSMVSDASSGPRQQHSAGSGQGAAALANARADRMLQPAAARRKSNMAAAVASTLLEDTASSPAFFRHSKVRPYVVMCSPAHWSPCRHSSFSCLDAAQSMFPISETVHAFAICR